MGADRNRDLERWGHRVEYRVRAPERCPIRQLDVEVTGISVFWNDGTINCDYVTRNADGEITVHHASQSDTSDCPCAVVFENDAIPRIRPSRTGTDGDLCLTTYVQSPERAEQITAALREVSSSFEVIDYREIGAGEEWSARLDLAGLTDKQREAIRMAMLEGYYEMPSETTVEELAAMTGISSSAFATRLRKAEREIFSQLLEYV
ncbi:MAG: helix-turn-helix domain-containing protein [Halobacteriota archaeon]